MIDTVALAIRAAAPKADSAKWSTALVPPMQSSGIVTARRIAMFIGQIAYESQWFEVLSEDLDYTHPERLRGVFPSHFPVGTDPTPYCGNPEALANFVYADRNGNGDEASGDGWRFRGRGLIQITGRANYTGLAQSLGKTAEDIADWVATPAGAAISACWFWSTRPALARAADNWIITDATRVINPALVGVGARIEACNQVLATLAATSVQVAQADAPADPTPSDTDHDADLLMAAEMAASQNGA